MDDNSYKRQLHGEPPAQGVVIEPYRSSERAVQVQFPTSMMLPDTDTASAEPGADVHWPKDFGLSRDVVKWAWQGLAAQAIAAMLIWMIKMTAADPHLGLIGLFAFPFALIGSITGLIFSVKAMRHSHRAKQPALIIYLGLLGILAMVFFAFYYILPC